jgi:uncharacterized protein
MAETILDGDELDLERLALRSGEARRLRVRLRPSTPLIGGQRYEIAGGSTIATVEVSRTSAGFALRLLARVSIEGPCARCLERAAQALEIEAREVEQSGSEDPELSSPYVDAGVLDVDRWLADAIRLALPEKVLCRPECAGICEICGASLNDLEPGSHTHERPPDPRFAKLRELLDE